ncbi:DUF1285 domain-containing protein [Methylocella sp.]|uniref:DUF1285 domain-containing protein n=1 Tax=Methylocella sp. TaxID=1978226 RepID=UPI003C15B025
MADEFPAKDERKGEGAATLAHLHALASATTAAPIEQWNPPFCGDIDMRIARDGAWFYQGTPIRRPALVRLFSTILRKDPERYVLVTPVERVGIRVDDAPFVAVEIDIITESYTHIMKFRTNVDDWVRVDAAHPLRFEREASGGVKPYVRVRGDLWALVTRALAFDLVALCERRAHEGGESFGVASAGAFFPLADAQEFAAIEAGL